MRVKSSSGEETNPAGFGGKKFELYEKLICRLQADKSIWRGPGIAVKSTARKLAVLYWRLMVKGLAYTEKGTKDYEEKLNLQKEKWLLKTANEMGYKLTEYQHVA